MIWTPTHNLSRLVSLALVGVLLFLAGFAIWTGREIAQITDGAKVKTYDVDLARQVQYRLGQQILLESEYPTTKNQAATRATFQTAVSTISSSLLILARAHTDLRPTVRRLQTQESRYIAGVRSFFALVDRGKQQNADAMEVRILDPLSGSMTRTINSIARVESEEALAALVSLQRTEDRVRVNSIIVAIVCLMLAGSLVVALELYQHRRRIEHLALAASEERYRSLVDTSPDAIVLADLTGTILVVNPAAAVLYGYASPDALRGVHALALTAPEDHQRMRAAIAEAVPSRASDAESVEFRQMRKDGSTFPAETHAGVIRDINGHPTSFQVTIRDISARRQAEETTHQLAAIVEAASDAILRTTTGGIVTSWNAGAQRLYGYSAAEMIGLHISLTVPPDRLVERDLLLERVAHGGSVKHFETVRIRKDGHRLDVSISIDSIQDAQARTTAYAITAYDIAERKQFEEQLKHQALHDALTHLPNRTLLYDRLEQAILASHRGATTMALLLMDLNRFKEVNDSLGHHAGDVLLQEAAIRVQTSLRESDTVARLGGDEFAIILPAVDEPRANVIADKIETALRQPLILDGHPIDISASIGVALYPAHGIDASTLLRRADVAMYSAKRSGEAHRTYASDQDLNNPSRLALVADLRDAIDHDHLVLHYQPKVSIRTGETEHVEALVRWKHPDHGLMPPGEFIALAEETGLIEPLTVWVLKTALRQCAEWRAIGLTLSVAVNLCARNLHDPHLPETISWLLRSAAVDASSLILEITESSLMDDPDGSLAVLTRLHVMGVKISIDDFGTGYSSLAYLKQLPVDEIKIDRSFVLGMTRTGTVIVRSVIDLGRNLGLEVVAEGVEDEAMLDMLARMGCSTAQGYFLSRPLPAEDLTAWMLAPARNAPHPAAV